MKRKYGFDGIIKAITRYEDTVRIAIPLIAVISFLPSISSPLPVLIDKNCARNDTPVTSNVLFDLTTLSFYC